MASLHRVESGAGLEPGGVLDENLDLPKLLLYGSGIYSALTLALHPLSVLKTRAQASTAPSSLSRGDALRRELLRPELCSGETRVYHHVEAQLPALCGKSAAAAEPSHGAGRQRPSPRSAAHVSSRGCAATPDCCARHPGACRTKEA